MFNPLLEGESISEVANKTKASVRDVVREVIRHNLPACFVYDGHEYYLWQTQAADCATVDKNKIIQREVPGDALLKLILNDPAGVELEITDSKGHKSLVSTSISSANVFVRRKDAIDHLGYPDKESTAGDIETREQETLHILIAALAEEAKTDISKPSKAANQIEKLTQLIGARVAPRTIEEHLKRVAKTLEKRATP